MTLDQSALTRRLQELTEKLDVPGAVLGVLVGDDVTTAAVGVLNRETGVETTADSLFQIGSITKVLTASLVERFVERGELDLDVPVRTYLPDFRVADETASATVTLRHLLTHSSGIDGDHFLDTGRGGDALEKYVASCTELGQQFPVGATMSYCNAGYSIIGRILETVSGKVWDQVLQDELCAPLGLQETFTLAEDVVRFRAACGHLGEPGALVRTPQWSLPRSSGPAGLVTASAADVLTFARAFLRGGRDQHGEPWLSDGTVAAMLEPQVRVPNPHTFGEHWALGWICYADGVYGHDGSALGQSAYLRVVPGADVAVVLLANGGGVADLAHTVLDEVLREVAGVSLPPQLGPVEGASGGDRSTQVGRYPGPLMTYDIEESGDAGLNLVLRSNSPLAAAMMGDAPITIELLPVEESTYVGRMPGADGWTSVVFFSLEDGARFMHLGARATALAE